MKNISPELQSHLNSGTTTLCWCWRLTCADNTTQGFTDHDEPVAFAGVTYEATTGFTASEVQSSMGLAVDNLTLMGALNSDALNESDLAAGLYDNAHIEIWRVNWADPDQRVLMRKGNLGEVKRGKTAFTAEVRGLAHLLNQPTGRVFAYGCDADLGDARCTIDLADPAFNGEGAAAQVTDARRFTASGLGAFADGWFTGGKLTWQTGANAGRAMEVKRHALAATTASVELWQQMSEPIAPGDSFIVTAGCDKQFATCKTKFTNAANFRGFPYMPGNDAVVSPVSRTQPSTEAAAMETHNSPPLAGRSFAERTGGEATVQIARSWIGTPYIHQASVKHAGCDCLGLLRGIWRELHGEEPQSIPPYSEDWSELSGEETLRNALAIHMREINKRDIAPGDIAVFRMSPHAPAKHCGVIGENVLSEGAAANFTSPSRGGRFREAKTGGGQAGRLTLIHARQNKRVSEEPLSLFWRRKLAFAFRFGAAC